MAVQWQVVKDVFHRASALMPAERDAFLHTACAETPGVRDEVEALLASLDGADDFLEPAGRGASAPLDTDASRRNIGAYQIISELGRGGMGAVYLAVRVDDAYQKRVAIKLVKRGMDSDEIVARFRHERQTLARLDHPNIARIVDGGTTDDGRPYLVMDYVDGVRIDEYCDRERLSIGQRLTLFRTVCAAVHYAHQNLVVHRDVKPENILVTGDGVAKLLDFGIAKVLTGDPADAAAHVTLAVDRRVTLSHASPEQLRGLAVTTATDVYSLGVLLYELLCGHLPHEARELTTAEAPGAGADRDPLPPSQRTGRNAGGDADAREARDRIASSRATTPGALVRLLAGDLDLITLVSLRRDPQRRYASAEQFAEDLRRYQHGLPVMARGDTLGYRLTKFVRRHQLGVAALAIAAIALIAGIATTTWQAREADRERRLAMRRFSDVRQLANTFIFEIHDAIADVPGTTAARALLVRRALDYLDTLAAESADDRTLQYELAAAYQRVGDVQGNPTNANLGDIDEARRSYLKASTIAEALVAADPDDRAAWMLLARLQQRAADLLAFSGNVEEAVAASRRAAALYETQLRAAPDDGNLRLGAAVNQIKMGDVIGNPDFPNIGERDEALAHYRAALPLIEALPAPLVRERLRYLGIIHERLGRMSEEADARDDALAHYRISLAHRSAFADAEPAHTDARRDVDIAYEKIGNMLRSGGDMAGALSSYLTARAVYQALHDADPLNVNAARTLVIGHEHVGNVLFELGDLAGAERDYRAALELGTRLGKRAPANVQVKRDRARLHHELGDTAARLLGRRSEPACSWYRRSLQVYSEVDGRTPDRNSPERVNLLRAIASCG